MADTKNMTAEAVETADERKPLLSVKDLRKAFPIKKSLTGKVQQELIAVDNVSFDLYPGETLGIVGESGCGKTTMGRTILKLHPSSGGQIIFDGKDITNYSSYKMRDLRIASLDQDFTLPGEMSVRECVQSGQKFIHNLLAEYELASTTYRQLHQKYLQFFH